MNESTYDLQSSEATNQGNPPSVDLLDDVTLTQSALQPALLPLEPSLTLANPGLTSWDSLRKVIREGKFSSGAEFAQNMNKQNEITHLEHLCYLQCTLYFFLKIKKYKAVISEAALYGITLNSKSTQLVNDVKKLCLDNIGEKGAQLTFFTLYLILVAQNGEARSVVDRQNIINAFYSLLYLLRNKDQYEELFFTHKLIKEYPPELEECCNFYSELGGLIQTELLFSKAVIIFKLKQLHFMMKQFRPTFLLFQTYAPQFSEDLAFMLEHCKAYLELGKFEEARVIYEKAQLMTLNSSFNEKSSVILSAALFDLYQGNYDQALQKYATVSGTRDLKGISQNNEACCHVLIGNVDHATKMWEALLLTQGKVNSYPSISKNLGEFLYAWVDINSEFKNAKLKAYSADHYRESFKQ